MATTERLREGLRGAGRVAALLGVVMGTAANAQQVNGLKVGYIDAEAVLLQAPQTQAALMELQDEFAPRQRDLVAMRDSLVAKQETYERDQAVMGEGERSALEREIRDLQRDLQRADNEFREDLNIRRNEVLAVAQQSVSEQISTYANSSGYDLILQNAVFYSSAVDITRDVLSYLQANRPAVETESGAQ
jgi:outer membrane protein